MPRTFPTSVQGKLNQRLGTEPLVIVEIEWAVGNPVAYSDRKLNGADYPHPLLHQIGNFDTTTIVDGSGDSQSVQITLNDIDGSIRGIIGTNDIHLNPVKVYLGFQGLPVTEKALMFEGVINSPIVWDEGTRTLSFTVFSKLEDTEVGFTMEDGDFPFVPPADRNRAWPLVFGQVCNMEAVPVTSNRKGFLAAGQGVADPTIEERLCQAYHLRCPKVTEQVTDPITGQTSTVDTIDEDQACLTRRFNEICTLLTEQDQQEQYVEPVLTIRGGESFPQNQPITIQIADVIYDGIMVGEEFTITQTYHPDLEIDNPECKPILEATRGYRYRAVAGILPQNLDDCERGGSDLILDIVDGSSASWEYYHEFQKGKFIWLPAGTEVFLHAEAEIVNIVSLIPGTVDQVAAYRTYGDTTLLSEVNPDRYTVITTDFGGYDVVEVRLNGKLSLIPDEQWSDEIYVSFTSDVGPNPADVIQWLVETYTEYTVDPATFAAVHSSLVNYPANFYLKERKSVLEVIRDIAYQFRCAVFIRDGVVYMVYLSKEPDSLKTLTESDIVSNTFQFSHSVTEDLKTSHLVRWSEGDAGVNREDPTDFEFVIKHNVPKYGTLSDEHDYYTQNTFDTILKSSTFWMIRRANTWRFVEFETPITHLDLDVFDCVTLNIEAFPNTKVVIVSTDYDVDSNTIRFKAWTPILSGTESPHFWAWPALQDPAAIFPLEEQDSSIGDGVNRDITPPVGHPLRGGYDPETARIQTAGDKHPSDLDDEFPEVECKIATGAEIQDAVEPDITPFEPLAQKNFENELQRQEERRQPGARGAPGNEKKGACGENFPGQGGGGCEYEVKVTYITPTLVTVATPLDPTGNCTGPCACHGTPGRPCTGPQYVFCHTFGAFFAATAFQSSKQMERDNLWENCLYQCGKPDVLQVSGIKGFEGSNPIGGDCEDSGGSGDGPSGAPGSGYGNPIYEPTPDDPNNPNNPPAEDLISESDLCRFAIIEQINQLSALYSQTLARTDLTEANKTQILNSIVDDINALESQLSFC